MSQADAIELEREALIEILLEEIEARKKGQTTYAWAGMAVEDMPQRLIDALQSRACAAVQPVGSKWRLGLQGVRNRLSGCIDNNRTRFDPYRKGRNDALLQAITEIDEVFAGTSPGMASAYRAPVPPTSSELMDTQKSEITMLNSVELGSRNDTPRKEFFDGKVWDEQELITTAKDISATLLCPCCGYVMAFDSTLVKANRVKVRCLNYPCKLKGKDYWYELPTVLLTVVREGEKP